VDAADARRRHAAASCGASSTGARLALGQDARVGVWGYALDFADVVAADADAVDVVNVRWY
jgi:hypothetical protein